jgi:tRNA(Ile)-lysidine synthase
MGRLGPWDGARRVAVAVSGGPDSLALAVLARAWGDPIALIVDHGLRAESAAEAEGARTAMLGLGVPARVLRLDHLHKGAGLASRARAARYAALAKACREAGLVDLLLGHHAGDQAETVLMRQRRGSGPAGRAGMAALVETDDIRLLRPLLTVDPAELRSVVAETGLIAAEDPSNTDERATRVRLRGEIGTDRAALLAEAAECGSTRTKAERAVAAELAARASLYPEGYAVISPGPVTEPSLAAVLRSVSGRRYPLAAAALAASPRAATLAGVQLQVTAGGWRLTREAAAMSAAIPTAPGAVWDGRFRVEKAPDNTEIGPLGGESVRFRNASDLPSTVLRGLPALRYNGVLSAVPLLGYGLPAMVADRVVLRNACLPAAGAAFLAA